MKDKKLKSSVEKKETLYRNNNEWIGKIKEKHTKKEWFKILEKNGTKKTDLEYLFQSYCYLGYLAEVEEQRIKEKSILKISEVNEIIWLKLKGYTTKEIADKVGTTKSIVEKYEKTPTNDPTIIAIYAEILNNQRLLTDLFKLVRSQNE